jgi:hypothetical protein
MSARMLTIFSAKEAYMSRRKDVLLVLGLVSLLSFAVVAQVDWIASYTSPFGGAAAHFSFTNTSGATADVLHLEFEEEVTLTYSIAIGGIPVLMGEATGMTFDFVGAMISNAEIYTIWEPVTAVPVFGQWLAGGAPAGSPHIGSIAVLGRLFGQGIVAVREANPAALGAAFEQFFADNAEYFAVLVASIGIDLQSQLMPIIMTAPAEGIENFFGTIVGMLGVSSLGEVLGGDVNFGALFALLGL